MVGIIDGDWFDERDCKVTIGDTMPDGTIYAGISPDTGKAMYSTPEDAPLTSMAFSDTKLLTSTFNEAIDYANTLEAHGHKDWRVPTRNELNQLFFNRAAIGRFNETGSASYLGGWYRSSSLNTSSELRANFVWIQRFSDGRQVDNIKLLPATLRCVRG